MLLVLIHRWMLTYLVTILRKLIKRRKDVSGRNRMIRKSHETRDRRNMSLRASLHGSHLALVELTRAIQDFFDNNVKWFLESFWNCQFSVSEDSNYGRQKVPVSHFVCMASWQQQDTRRDVSEVLSLTFSLRTYFRDTLSPADII